MKVYVVMEPGYLFGVFRSRSSAELVAERTDAEVLEEDLMD